MKEIYVLATPWPGRRKEAFLPDPDHQHFYGPPDLFAPVPVDRILVSATFTWDRSRAESLATQWQAQYPRAEVLLGGPAYGDPGGEFVPGRWLRRGVTITTRGCPGCALPCLVPGREGGIRTLPIVDGWNIQDNNLLAAPRAHVERVCEMLDRQPRAAIFSGGIEARRLLAAPWFVERLKTLRVERLFLAYDRPPDREPVVEAIRVLREIWTNPRKVGCYVLVGRGEDTIPEAEERVCTIFRAGGMPFAMLWRGEESTNRFEPGWKQFVRRWTRPALIFKRKGAAA